MTTRRRWFVCMLASMMAAGCSAAARSSGIVPPSLPMGTRVAATVQLEVGGGTGDEDLISNREFRAALEQALRASGPFAAVVPGSGATYRLDVLLFSQNHPVVGFSLTSELQTVWTLTRIETGEVVWRDSVQSKYTTSYGDAFLGVERMRLTAEGAARENVQEGMEKLWKLNLT